MKEEKKPFDPIYLEVPLCIFGSILVLIVC